MSIRYVDNYIRFAPYTDPSVILTLIVMGDCANDEGYMWYSVGDLAWRARLSQRRFRELVQKLEGEGVLTRTPRQNRSNIWQMRLFPELALEGARPDTAPRVGDTPAPDPDPTPATGRTPASHRRGGLRATAGEACEPPQGRPATGRSQSVKGSVNDPSGDPSPRAGADTLTFNQWLASPEGRDARLHMSRYSDQLREYRRQLESGALG